MSNAVPIYEAKNKLTSYIHQAESEGPVTLTRHNQEVAVIISKAEYDSLVAKAREQQNKKPFLVRVKEFHEEHKGLYSDEEIDSIFNLSRNYDCPRFDNAAHLFDGIMEGAND